MGSVIIKPITLEEQLEEDQLSLVQLHIRLNSADFDGLYDQLEVWRSTSTSAGPFEELTAVAPKPARLPKSAQEEPEIPVVGRNISIDGLTLLVRVNEKDDYTITFSNPDTYLEAAVQVAEQGQGRIHAYVDPRGIFVLETTGVGSSATIRVTGGEAAQQLGLSSSSPDDFNFGREGSINLSADVQEYDFSDLMGSKKFYYRTRFRNRSSFAVSEFSQPVLASALPGLSSSSLVRGYLTLVTGDGLPLSGRQVSVYSPLRGTLVEDKLVTGGGRTKLTNASGYVEFDLVRGTQYTVSVAGTDLVREIVAPVDASVSSFSLLGPDFGTQDDVFRVQVPDVVFAERRTL